MKDEEFYLTVHARTVGEYNDFANSAVIKISKGIVKGWIDKVMFGKRANRQYNDLTEIEYREYTTWVVGNVDEGQFRISRTMPKLNENVDALQNDRTVVSSEVDRMRVSLGMRFFDYIQFTAYADNTNSLLETCEFSLKELRELHKALTTRKFVKLSYKPARMILKLRMKAEDQKKVKRFVGGVYRRKNG